MIAYTVSRRTAEIGIRMALGAGTADVIVMVVGEGARLSVVGIGIAAAIVGPRREQTLPAGVERRDEPGARTRA